MLIETAAELTQDQKFALKYRARAEAGTLFTYDLHGAFFPVRGLTARQSAQLHGVSNWREVSRWYEDLGCFVVGNEMQVRVASTSVVPQADRTM